MTWTSRFYRWLYRSKLGRVFFDDLDSVVAALAAAQHEVGVRTTEVTLAAQLLEQRDGEYANLAQRCARAETERDLWRRFYNKSMPEMGAA